MHFKTGPSDERGSVVIAVRSVLSELFGYKLSPLVVFFVLGKSKLSCFCIQFLLPDSLWLSTLSSLDVYMLKSVCIKCV